MSNVETSCSCPFKCGGVADRERAQSFGHCNRCRAIVHYTTSAGRLKIIDSLVKGGALAMEISQVVDYHNRKKIPEREDSQIIFAIRQVAYR